MEIELKLALNPAHVTRVKRHPLLAGVKTERQTLHSIYYDTPDFALTRRLIALRLRRVGYHWVQTLKAAAPSVGALSSRPEWEAQVMGNEPDLAVLAEEARALLDGIDLRRLAPVVITDVKRTTWQVEAGETTMEIALDQGEIRAGENTHPVSEIEIELKSGPPHALFDAAFSLLERVPLGIDSRSKAALGYRLAGAVESAPVKARWPKLNPKAAAGPSWASLVEAALTQLVDNLPGYLEQPEDIEYLHQVRVALRRLMSLARLLGPLAHPDPDWLEPLRDVMTVLNPARDWDVFLAETLPRLALPDDTAFQTRATEQAAAARTAAQAALSAPTFTHAVLTLGRSLLTPPVSNLNTRDWAVQVLDQRWKTVRRRGERLSGEDPIPRHRLRIAVKKLRYATDALVGLYGRRGSKPLEKLETLQESLGALNDLAVAERLMHHLAARHPETAFSAGRVVGLLSAEAARHTDTDAAIQRELAAIKAFWRGK